MKLLAIDTATQACSAALVIDDEVRERHQHAPRAHAELILPLIDALLAEAELSLSALDALAFGRGPGAFTGVRVATATVQGLAFGADLPVAPISDLAALAQGAWREHRWRHVLACMDARMRELYFGAFELADDDLMVARARERVAPSAELSWSETQLWYGAGSGWGVDATLMWRAEAQNMRIDAAALPHARDIAALAARDWRNGALVTAAEALPVYLRDTIVTPRRY